jgi:hypothetical protein
MDPSNLVHNGLEGFEITLHDNPPAPTQYLGPVNLSKYFTIRPFGGEARLLLKEQDIVVREYESYPEYIVVREYETHSYRSDYSLTGCVTTNPLITTVSIARDVADLKNNFRERTNPTIAFEISQNRVIIPSECSSIHKEVKFADGSYKFNLLSQKSMQDLKCKASRHKPCWRPNENCTYILVRMYAYIPGWPTPVLQDSFMKLHVTRTKLPQNGTSNPLAGNTRHETADSHITSLIPNTESVTQSSSADLQLLPSTTATHSNEQARQDDHDDRAENEMDMVLQYEQHCQDDIFAHNEEYDGPVNMEMGMEQDYEEHHEDDQEQEYYDPDIDVLWFDEQDYEKHHEDDHEQEYHDPDIDAPWFDEQDYEEHHEDDHEQEYHDPDIDAPWFDEQGNQDW